MVLRWGKAKSARRATQRDFLLLTTSRLRLKTDTPYEYSEQSGGGGNRRGPGIGRAIALKLAASGADVVCVSRTMENSEKVAAEVKAAGRKSWAYAVDVSDGAAVAAAGEKILGEAGHVDILVNNAGVTRDGLIMRMSSEDWDVVLNTNLKGAFLFTKAFSALSSSNVPAE